MKIKRIIEIDEEEYKAVSELSEREKVNELSYYEKIIAQSTPYNPTGDCISREALKEQINATDFDCGDFYDNTEIIRESVCNAIDNAQAIPLLSEQIAWEQGYEAGLAQAVEITEEQAINKLHETGWLIGHDKEMTERPQGECRTCRHRDTEDKKCDCGALERQGCPFPVSDDYFCKFYEKGGAE